MYCGVRTSCQYSLIPRPFVNPKPSTADTVSQAKDCDVMCIDRGKITFADSRTVLHCRTDQTFMLRFGPIRTFLRHTITGHWSKRKVQVTQMETCLYRVCIGLS